MSSQTPQSPRTPQRQQSTWKYGHASCSKSPSFISGPDCCSTPSSISKKNGAVSLSRNLWSGNTPPKHSPISKQSQQSQECTSHRSILSLLKENESELSASSSKQMSSTDPSWSKTFSSTDTNGTVTVELDFPHGGWDEESSDDGSSCSLEIVESEVDCSRSSDQRGRKRKQSEVAEEDNAILSGMGEEIERQLEAKAERNRLTVPNVKNILKSVITNPYVQAMVRRSIKSGDVSVSGDTDDVSFEPRLTRAKARLLCDNEPDVSWPDGSWTGTPQKLYQPSECQALINEDLNDDSEDDEEYQPCEDDPSDNDYSERDGSERGSERDMSAEQSPACFDTDTESCPPTPIPSPKTTIIDSATQTNWSDDGVFKVPLVPPEPHVDQKDENIALRTRSKLPLNDTPLEEIEQAFIPPDITPDLYDTTCDNADWQEFLKEFMQPMRSEPDVQNHDDDEEDPEYNVLAEEEIIDKEELRRDRAVKVSKRELNDLMRELMEFTENMSSEDEDKGADKKKGSNNEEMSLFLDAYMSLGTLAPLSLCKTTPPPARSPSTPSLNTPVPPMSPPCSRTPGTGKKIMHSDVNPDIASHYLSHVIGDKSSTKAKPAFSTPGKKPYFPSTPGKFNGFDIGCESSTGKQSILVENGPFNVVSTESNAGLQFFSPGKDYFFQNPSNDWEKSNACESAGDTSHPSAVESQNPIENSWNNDNAESRECHSVSAAVDEGHLSDAESSITLPVSTSSQSHEDGETISVNHELSKFKPSEAGEEVKLSPDGDVLVENNIVLSAAQRLVLDQQIRQYVQLLTQSFLQTYQHPVHGHYALFCKDHLVKLHTEVKRKDKSSLKAANLIPAVESVKLWEDKFLTEEGPAIQRFMENQVSLARRKKNRRNRYLEKFPPQLMNFMAESTVFIYPQLLPTMPFRTISEKKMFLPSEDYLLAIGLEEFSDFIEENNPGSKKKGCLRWAMSYVTEYLLIGKDPDILSVYSRKKRAKEGSPLQYYFEHKCAPPTSHLVTPFCEQKMIKLRMQPHYLLPALWRDFLYPALRP